MIVGCPSQSIKNRGRVRVPSSPIDVLSRHLEHVALTDPAADPHTPAEVLDSVSDPRSRRGRRYRLGPLPASALLAVLSGEMPASLPVPALAPAGQPMGSSTSTETASHIT